MSDDLDRMVFIDGCGDRYRPGPVLTRQWLMSERTGRLVEVTEQQMRRLAVELDGNLVKPLTTDLENYGGGKA